MKFERKKGYYTESTEGGGPWFWNVTYQIWLGFVISWEHRHGPLFDLKDKTFWYGRD